MRRRRDDSAAEKSCVHRATCPARRRSAQCVLATAVASRPRHNCSEKNTGVTALIRKLLQKPPSINSTNPTAGPGASSPMNWKSAPSRVASGPARVVSTIISAPPCASVSRPAKASTATTRPVTRTDSPANTAPEAISGSKQGAHASSTFSRVFSQMG